MDKLNSNKKRQIKWLGTLQVFIGIGAVPAGLAMVIHPAGNDLGMTIEMLSKSPFPDFFIPGIFLLTINGFGNLLGAVVSFLHHPLAGKIAVGLGLFLILWITVQVYWLGFHWLHLLYFILGIIELTLGLKFFIGRPLSIIR